MGKREQVDFHSVPEHQLGMDKRLHNWARWCASRSVGYSCPMFRWAKPAQHWDPVYPPPPVDTIDAMRIEKGVCALPENHRAALQWCYVLRFAPAKACRTLGVAMDTLAKLVIDGRQMLANRGV